MCYFSRANIVFAKTFLIERPSFRNALDVFQFTPVAYIARNSSANVNIDLLRHKFEASSPVSRRRRVLFALL